MTTATRSQAAIGAGAVGEPTPATPPTTRYRRELLCGAKIRGTAPGIKLKPGEKPRTAGQPCRIRKGLRTSHPGSGRCWLHGGRSPNGRAAAAKEQATNELRALVIPDSVDPISEVLDAVAVSTWRERGLRAMLQRREALHGPDHLGDEREDVVSAMHARALKQKAEIAALAVSLGIERRWLSIAESQAEMMVKAVQAALDSLDLSPDARARAEAAAADVMDPVVPVGAELN